MTGALLTVTVPVARDDPAGGVAHLVYERVPQPVPAVDHLGAQLYPAAPRLNVVCTDHSSSLHL